MKTTYRQISGDQVHMTTATVLAPLFGRWCSLSVTAYCPGDELAITFALAPAERSACPDSPFEALPDGILRVRDGAGASYRVVEQEIVFRPLNGWVLELSDVRDGGVEAGRMIVAAVLRKLEAVFETVRQTVRRGIAEGIRGRAIPLLRERFQQATRRTITELPGSLHWPLLLDGSGCGDECLNVVSYSLAHNPPNFRDIDIDGDSGIPTVGNESACLDPGSLADARAATLLRRVCGEPTAEEFRQTGRITVESGGYRFVIAPRAFVECTDPNGRRGRLCIHTAGLSCNPIDELIVAYLSIRYRLREYLRTAIVRGHEPDFSVAIV